MRQRLVAGNWKMHGSIPENQVLLDAVARLSGRLQKARCVVCVPFPYLQQAQAALGGSRAGWGAQNVSEHVRGAYTGEVSVSMLREFGCAYVIVGHSERRAYFGEGDDTVAAKAKVVLDSGMVPIVCVGESLSEREGGLTERVVARQLDAVLAALGAGGLAKSVLAYEPVWAIGTGRTATPEQAQAVHVFLRSRVGKVDGGAAELLRILYGGSVKAGNAQSLFAMQDIDGGLIGGASLNAEEFAAICQAADR